MMRLIDSHSHMFAAEFEQDITNALKSARDNGIEKIILPNIDLDSIEPMLALSAAHPGLCLPTLGLHPCSVQAGVEAVLGRLKPLFDQHRFYAVGEIGIDLYWDKTYLKEQQYAFETQVSWAKELGLPVIIHVRESFNEVFDIIDKLNSPELTGIFHCFTGNAEQAQHIIGYGGFKMGIGGVVTYKTSTLPEVLKSVDPKHLVLETDSPYLPPVPFRGKRNESAYIIYVAKKLAEVYGMPLDEIAAITTKNAEQIFKLN